MLTLLSDNVRAIRTNGINAAATNTSTSASRLSNLKAAASATDPKLKVAYEHARRGVLRLGFSLDQIAEAGGVRQLDAAMTEKRWNNEERIALKSALAAISVIA
jgi:hypothetical protein